VGAFAEPFSPAAQGDGDPPFEVHAASSAIRPSKPAIVELPELTASIYQVKGDSCVKAGKRAYQKLSGACSHRRLKGWLMN
jgi:hypothetical protein